jgi:AraC-like DNA-binding protein
MVCDRCKNIVGSEFDRIGIQYRNLNLGIVDTVADISPLERKKLGEALHESGIELIDERRYELIEKLKEAVVNLELHSDENLNTSFVDFISQQVDDNFLSLNTLFAEIEGISIEKYIVIRKIERVKELLVYEHLDLTEIARKLNYSNTTKLSNQFKNITGLSPMHFKKLRLNRNNGKPGSQLLATENPSL